MNKEEITEKINEFLENQYINFFKRIITIIIVIVSKVTNLLVFIIMVKSKRFGQFVTYLVLAINNYIVNT